MLRLAALAAAACGAASASAADGLCAHVGAEQGYLSAACARTVSWVDQFPEVAAGAPEQFVSALVQSPSPGARRRRACCTTPLTPVHPNVSVASGSTTAPRPTSWSLGG